MLGPRYSGALLTDLYELTMAQAAWRNGMNRPATFSLYFRGYRQDRGYYAVAGIESALDYLESVHFNKDDIEYLRSTSIFDPEFLSVLESLRFTGTARAMNEGSIAFAGEPVLEVTAPLIQAQIVETSLLNLITFPTSTLTKAARIVHAAAGRPVIEFGARRAQSSESADLAARSAAIAGFAGTSNLRAAARFDIPAVGTMAHSFIQSFDDELEAFRAYAAEFPASTTLLVDTYDTLTGVQNAITVAKEMEERGEKLRAVRLDSGDMLALSKESRTMLDGAGLNYVQIIASGGFDEYSIDELVSAGAPIDGFGVGTRYVVSADAPYIDSVYKLVEFDGSFRKKFSPGKESLPGPKQVYRFTQDGRYTHDLLALEQEPAPAGGEPLLSTAIDDGVRVREPETMESAAARLESQLKMVPVETAKLRSPELYRVDLSEKLGSA